jgi:hypothetical protein
VVVPREIELDAAGFLHGHHVRANVHVLAVGATPGVRGLVVERDLPRSRGAREVIREWRGRPEFRTESKTTLSRHGSRKRRQRGTGRPHRDTSQLSLFPTGEG